MSSSPTAIAALLDCIEMINRIPDVGWKETLNDRKRKELEFHDRDRDSKQVEAAKANDTFEKFHGNKKYYRATHRSREFVKQWISQESKDKVFLDYACGNGGYALEAAKSGATLSLGFDLSGISVENAQRAAKQQGLDDRCRFFQADAENTHLPDNSIDTIICSGMLHHLNLSYALPELRRILKPGGKLLAIEALDYNPAIKLYRHLTPTMRTEWEKAHILSLKDVRFASRFLEVEEIKYWHLIGYVGGKFPKLLPFLDRVDRALERVPYLQRMAWIFTFVLRKGEE